MSHSSHPDVHDAGLADNCGACATIAENPGANADEEVLRDLVKLALKPTGIRLQAARSETEAVAAVAVLNVFERFGRLAEVAPDFAERYLVERWHIECSFGATSYTRALKSPTAARLGIERERPDSLPFSADARIRQALRRHLVTSGVRVEQATPEEYVQAAADLLNDLHDALGPLCPPLDEVVALARRRAT